ncbi:TetR family transcriptional regulator [uncultured Corynebacterium sp.]|uniref:TetR family transcriptional regulator n=1 Tax=uncultured Corynebacterium sp. TaxID=159447 RepID=UPI0025D7AC1F|nr:TetR family transcriptional regulator [uncultured Corynebacterium sp.]
MQLTKDIIMDAALEILDEFGLQDLTIRRLARHLDAAAGAMYWHFPSKQALLGAVADRLLAPLSDVAATGDWRADVSSFADALHACLTSHRDGAEVVSAGLATGTVTLRPAALLAPLLAEAPITDPDRTLDAAATLVYFVLGATVDEQTAAQLAAVAGDDGDDGDAEGSNDSNAADGSADASVHARRIRHGVDLIVAGIAAGDS